MLLHQPHNILIYNFCIRDDLAMKVAILCRRCWSLYKEEPALRLTRSLSKRQCQNRCIPAIYQVCALVIHLSPNVREVEVTKSKRKHGEDLQAPGSCRDVISTNVSNDTEKSSTMIISFERIGSSKINALCFRLLTYQHTKIGVRSALPI